METMLAEPPIKEATTDVQGFQMFYQEKFRLIYRYVYSQVGNREDAEDLTSEIFLKAVSSIKYEHSPLSRHKWLYLIARSTIADYWRSHYRLPMSSLDELFEVGWEGPAEGEPAMRSSMPADRVQRLLQALPKRCQEVLTCRFLLNLSIKETALRMGMTVPSVKVLQFRALKRAADLQQAVTVKQVRAL